MAIVIEGEERLELPIQRVWEALNDDSVLRACIPGCESLEKRSDTEFTATVVLKVGPIKAKFVGEVTLSNLRPPFGYTIAGEGSGGIAGFAKGGAEVNLTEEAPNVTLLKYTTNVDIGGKIAQLGGRLISSTAKKLSAQFFSTLSDHLSKQEASAAV